MTVVRNNRFTSDEQGLFTCVFCTTKFSLDDMKNEISQREAGISGFCQKCQDETFGPDEDEEEVA